MVCAFIIIFIIIAEFVEIEIIHKLFDYVSIRILCIILTHKYIYNFTFILTEICAQRIYEFLKLNKYIFYFILWTE